MTRNAAVLTGDLIGSTSAGPDAIDQAMHALAHAACDLSRDSEQDTRFTRFRGDGWQLHLAHPRHALRACLMMIATLRASGNELATRISVGIGPVDRLGRTGLSEASGAAFVTSGHGLDMMPKSRRLTIAGGGADAEWQTSLFDLIEWLSRRWSREQAEAVMRALGPGRPAYGDIAQDLGISRQALQSRLNSAGYHAFQHALDMFESAPDPIKDTAEDTA